MERFGFSFDDSFMAGLSKIRPACQSWLLFAARDINSIMIKFHVGTCNLDRKIVPTTFLSPSIRTYFEKQICSVILLYNAKFNKGVTFYKKYFKNQNSNPNLWNHVARILCMFGSPYVCEQTFSTMKINGPLSYSRHKIGT